MTAPSDPVDLAEVRALLGAATSGPWRHDMEFRCIRFGPGVGSTIAHYVGVADAALIAAAPTLLAELADEVERLRGDVARVREAMKRHHIEGSVFTHYINEALEGM